MEKGTPDGVPFYFAQRRGKTPQEIRVSFRAFSGPGHAGNAENSGHGVDAHARVEGLGRALMVSLVVVEG